MNSEGTCSECESPVRTRGFCNRHYQWWRSNGGDVTAKPKVYRSKHYGVTERLAMKSTYGMPNFDDPLVRLSPGCKPCRLFAGETNKSGYGRIRVFSVKKLAHRAAYEETHGTIEGDLQLDHLCRNHACWEDSHLELVTPAENNRRGLSSVLVATCQRGHPFSGANLYMNHGHRYCRQCRSDAHRARRDKRALNPQQPQPEGATA